MTNSTQGTTGPGPLSLEHLVALNDEIAALSRAGLPLERGLREVGGDLSGRLGGAMRRLAKRMEQGASLPDALAAEAQWFPPLYRAVIEAGLRAGRLPAALEGLTGFLRGYLEARRIVGLALWYPTLVLVFAYALFLGLVTQFIPRILAAFESFRLPVPRALRLLEALGASASYWGAALPVALILLGLAWAWSGRAAALRAGRWSPLRWFPWMGPLLAQFEAANLAQMLAILVRNGVPLPDSVRLASESSGDPVLAREGREIAERLGRGEPPVSPGRGARRFPPLLLWLLTTARSQDLLAESLTLFAANYRKRALLQAEKMRVYLPTFLLLTIGTSATFLYALSLFLPFATLLRELSLSRA